LARSNTRRFEDEHANRWTVTKISFGRFQVSEGSAGSFIDGARSCVRRLGLISLSDGSPIEAATDHGRVWNLIWKHGEDVD
jgi:hypothetical protein